jgi:hypothetical protein
MSPGRVCAEVVQRRKMIITKMNIFWVGIR